MGTLTAVGGHQIPDKYPALPVVEWDHQRIHAGKSFHVSISNAVTNINEQTVLAFNVPSGYEVHCVFTAGSTHNATFNLYRDTDIDVGEGTQIAPANRRQGASPAATVLTSIEATPTAGQVTWYNETQAASANIDTTTRLQTEAITAGSGLLATILGGGSEIRGLSEWVFDGPVQVAALLNAETNDDATHKLAVDYYEVAK
jgi:hypothetical protein